MSASPSIKRRLIAMVYETFLLLAVTMLAVVLWMLVTHNRHDGLYRHGLTLYLFLVVGAYFIHAWSGSGHTLAMKTWRMRLVTEDGARVPPRRAALRYLLAWGWFLPALLVCGAAGVHDKRAIGAVVALGVVAWAMTAVFDRERRFLHDRLAGTRLVTLGAGTGVVPGAASADALAK